MQPNLVKGTLEPGVRAALLHHFICAIEQATRNQVLPNLTALRPDHVAEHAMSRVARVQLSRLLSEPLDRVRFDTTTGTYFIPSYRGGTAKVPISSGHNQSSALDWDAVWRALTGDDSIARFEAYTKIADLIEMGDGRAVTYALAAIRPDDNYILPSLRLFARRDPVGFRKLLRAIHSDLRTKPIVQTVKRRPDDFNIDTRYYWELDVLGGFARVLSDIPEARPLAIEFERKVTGLEGVGTLLAAVIEARHALHFYLTAPRPPTDVHEKTDPTVVERIRTITVRLQRFVGLVLVGWDNSQNVYELQNDLIEHQRWITATQAGIMRVDQILSIYGRAYGQMKDQTEEVKVLREARLRYIKAIAEHPFPTAARITELRAAADAFAADWAGLAAEKMYGRWADIVGKLLDAVQTLLNFDLVRVDQYVNRGKDTTAATYELKQQLRRYGTVLRGSDSLVLMNEIEHKFGLLPIQVNFCLIWDYAHRVMRQFTDMSIGTKYEREAWCKELLEIGKEIDKEFDRPTAEFQHKLDRWYRRIENLQEEVRKTAKSEAWVRIGVTLLVIVATAGVAAPEGAGIIAVSFNMATIATATSVALDWWQDKPISSKGMAWEFGSNLLLGSVSGFLDKRLFKFALNYHGNTLTRLSIVFGGGIIVNSLPPLLLNAIESGGWPDDITMFLAGCVTLNAVIGAFAAPKTKRALKAFDQMRLDALDQRKIAELRLAMAQLEEGHQAWIKEMDEIAKRGEITALEFETAKARGVSGFSEVKRVAEALLKLPDRLLAAMGLSRDAVTNLSHEAESLVGQLQKQLYETQPGVKRLASPAEIVPEGLTFTTGNAIEYNPNAAGMGPGELSRRFSRAGYMVQETGSALRLLAPGENVPRYLLLPAAASMPAPALARLVTPPGPNAAQVLKNSQTNVAKGLRVVQAQNAVPSLEGKLTQSVARDDVAVKRILEGMGRHIRPTDIKALQGIAAYLDGNGALHYLGVALGRTREYGSEAVRVAVARLGNLQPAEQLGVGVVWRIRGDGAAGTDSIVGIAYNFDHPGPLLAQINQLAPRIESGLEQLVVRLASTNDVVRQQAQSSVDAATALLMRSPASRLSFRQTATRNGSVLAVHDASVEAGTALRSYSELVQDLETYFTPAEVKRLCEFLANRKIALKEGLVDTLIERVPRGKMGEYIRHLEIKYEHSQITKSPGWSVEALTLEKTMTVHPSTPPRLSEIVETSGSTALRASLIKRLGEEPPPGYHAHHIIPEKEFGDGLAWLRERLLALTGINEADNGVFLAGRGGVGRYLGATPNPELTNLHISYIHAGSTKEYAYTLTRRLVDKHGGELLEEVRAIANEMRSGHFKFDEIPYGWNDKWKPGMTAPVEPGVQPRWINVE